MRLSVIIILLLSTSLVSSIEEPRFSQVESIGRIFDDFLKKTDLISPEDKIILLEFGIDPNSQTTLLQSIKELDMQLSDMAREDQLVFFPIYKHLRNTAVLLLNRESWPLALDLDLMSFSGVGRLKHNPKKLEQDTFLHSNPKLQELRTLTARQSKGAVERLLDRHLEVIKESLRLSEDDRFKYFSSNSISPFTFRGIGDIHAYLYRDYEATDRRLPFDKNGNLIIENAIPRDRFSYESGVESKMLHQDERTFLAQIEINPKDEIKDFSSECNWLSKTEKQKGFSCGGHALANALLGLTDGKADFSGQELYSALQAFQKSQGSAEMEDGIDSRFAYRRGFNFKDQLRLYSVKRIAAEVENRYYDFNYFSFRFLASLIQNERFPIINIGTINIQYHGDWMNILPNRSEDSGIGHAFTLVGFSQEVEFDPYSSTLTPYFVVVDSLSPERKLYKIRASNLLAWVSEVNVLKEFEFTQSDCQTSTNAPISRFLQTLTGR